MIGKPKDGNVSSVVGLGRITFSTDYAKKIVPDVGLRACCHSRVDFEVAVRKLTAAQKRRLG